MLLRPGTQIVEVPITRDTQENHDQRVRPRSRQLTRRLDWRHHDLVGFTVGTIAFWFDLPAIVWGSVGIVILGLILGFVFKRLGYGVGGAKVTTKAHE